MSSMTPSHPLSHIMRKLSAHLLLIRPINCAIVGLAVIVGALLSKGWQLTSWWPNVCLGFFTGFCVAGASMALNDYFDREIDAVNEPHRPIPSGAISPDEALTSALALTAAGLSTAALTNASCLALAVVAWTLSVIYAAWGKRVGLVGNAMVSACVAIPFVYGGLAIEELEPAVLIFVAMAFLSNVGREVTKGIVDVEGDRLWGVKTIAVLFGRKTAASIASAFYVSAVALSPFPIIWSLVSLWYVPFVLAADIGLIASSIALLKDCSFKRARYVKNLALLWFSLGLLAFAFGSLKA